MVFVAKLVVQMAHARRKVDGQLNGHQNEHYTHLINVAMRYLAIRLFGRVVVLAQVVLGHVV